jgi:hypothetical protein
VELFVCPDHTAIEPRTFLTFRYGNTDAFQIGFVLYSTVFSAVCIISDYYYPSLFHAMLKLPQAELLVQAKALAASVARNSVQMHGRDFPLDGSCERQQLLKLLFTTFPPYDITKIIIGLLQARHVFVVASNASTCSKFTTAILLLIEPFTWEMTMIPILPTRIVEMIMSPVPVLVGLTMPENLDSTVESSRVCVNCDVKLVIDTPVFEADSPLRLKVLEEQLKFQATMTDFMKTWHNRPFPHVLATRAVQGFLKSYLECYTGSVASLRELRDAFPSLPEYMQDSQVLSQLLEFDELPPDRRADFTAWFTNFLPEDRKNTPIEIAPAGPGLRTRPPSKPPTQQQQQSPPPVQAAKPPATAGWSGGGGSDPRRSQTVVGGARPGLGPQPSQEAPKKLQIPAAFSGSGSAPAPEPAPSSGPVASLKARAAMFAGGAVPAPVRPPANATPNPGGPRATSLLSPAATAGPSGGVSGSGSASGSGSGGLFGFGVKPALRPVPQGQGQAQGQGQGQGQGKVGMTTVTGDGVSLTIRPEFSWLAQVAPKGRK